MTSLNVTIAFLVWDYNHHLKEAILFLVVKNSEYLGDNRGSPNKQKHPLNSAAITLWQLFFKISLIYIICIEFLILTKWDVEL
jgi:hypothetical protein